MYILSNKIACLCEYNPPAWVRWRRGN